MTYASVRRLSILIFVAFWALGSVSTSRAQQFVFFDDILVQDSTGVPALERMGPPNLEAPVDYTEGNLYMRLEILQKPSDIAFRPAYFIWQDEDQHPDMGHMGEHRSDVPDLTEEGVYYLDYKNPNSWWHGEYPIPDWSRPFDKMALVPWAGNTSEQLYTVECWSHCFERGDIADHTPIVYRATGIWVAPGEELVPPDNWDTPASWEVDSTRSFAVEKNAPDPDNDELLLMDEVIVHEQGESMEKTMGFSGFQLPASVPSNWEKPIAYRDGTVHFRVSVLTKPTQAPIHYQMGFQWKGGCNDHYFKEKFPSNTRMRITEPGRYSWRQAIPTYWEQPCQEDDPVDWTRRMTRMLVVVWDDEPRVMDDRWGYHEEDMVFADYYPMVAHFQAVVVPPGQTFSGWDTYSIASPPGSR